MWHSCKMTPIALLRTWTAIDDSNDCKHGQRMVNMCNIREPCQIARPLVFTIKQYVKFQGGICSAKFQLDLIQNGRLAAIIDFNICNIYCNVLDRYQTFTLKQNVRVY